MNAHKTLCIGMFNVGSIVVKKNWDSVALSTKYMWKVSHLKIGQKNNKGLSY